jgi:hypothetical protein
MNTNVLSTTRSPLRFSLQIFYAVAFVPCLNLAELQLSAACYLFSLLRAWHRKAAPSERRWRASSKWWELVNYPSRRDDWRAALFLLSDTLYTQLSVLGPGSLLEATPWQLPAISALQAAPAHASHYRQSRVQPILYTISLNSCSLIQSFLIFIFISCHLIEHEQNTRCEDTIPIGCSSKHNVIQSLTRF